MKTKTISKEETMAYNDYLDAVQEIYIGYYLRPADPEGLKWWAQKVDDANGDISAVVDAFANSAESNRLWGEITSENIGDVIDQIYMALFNRIPDVPGKEYYIEGFNNGTFTPGTIVLDILNGAQNGDLTAIENKVEYANDFLHVLDQDNDFIGPFEATYNQNDEAEARALLALVTSTNSPSDDQVRQDIIDHIADPGDHILADEIPPVVAIDQAFTYEENQEVGAVLGTVAATDNDSGVASFDIVSGNEEGYFAIDANGAITLTAAGAAADPNDFETGDNGFPLFVTATDADGNTSAPVVVNLNVINTPMHLVSSTPADNSADVAIDANIELSFNEDVMVGTGNVEVWLEQGDVDQLFATIPVSDPSVTVNGSTVTIDLVDNLPSNTDVYIKMDPGALQEMDGAPYAGIIAEDALNFTTGDGTAPVIDGDQIIAYDENQAAGDVLGVVAAADNANGSGIESYAIVSGNDNGYFSINAAGELTLTAEGATSMANDFETAPNEFTLAITATDAAGNVSDAVNVVLTENNVDDTAPGIVAEAFDYAENQAVNTVVAQVHAADNEGGSGIAGYAIESGNAAGYFAIDAAGMISLTAMGVASAANDFEAGPNRFNLGVSVTDNAGNSAEALIVLNVLDADDNAPVITGVDSPEYDENSPVGAVLATIQAEDNTQVDGFAIVSGNNDGFFMINDNGEISLSVIGAASAANDFEQMPNEWVVEVTATDNEGNVSDPFAVTLSEQDVDVTYTGADMDGDGDVNDVLIATNGVADIFIFSYAGVDPNSATFIGQFGAFGADSIIGFNVAEDMIIFQDTNADGGAFVGEINGNSFIQLIPSDPVQGTDAVISLVGIDGGAILIQGIQDMVNAGVMFEFTAA
jgi:hypothetical protein